jgi:hypothetical protein
VALFPPGEGYVVSLPAGEVYIDLAEANLMRPGMELYVYREGGDIVHPVTGDVLGKHEESLGYLTIKEVREEYSVGEAVEGAKEMHPGDRVRISARPLRALLFFSGESPALDTDRMALALTEAAVESKRFRLRDEPEWLPRLGELNVSIDDMIADQASLRRLGEHAGADLLFVVTPPKDADSFLGFEVLSLWTGRSLAGFDSGWSTAIEASPPVEPAPDSSFRLFPSAKSKAPSSEYVSRDLPSSADSILIGDFRGEGEIEILVASGHRLALYSWKEGGLLWRWDDKGLPARRIVSLEAGDITGDGREEVVLTTANKGRLQTTVLSWSHGEWARLGKVEGLFVRVLHDGRGGEVIVGQRSGATTVFSGPVKEYRWEEGTFRPSGERTLPRGVDIFGLGLADLDGDGEAEVLSLSDEGRLQVFGADGRRRSRSAERYGGYPVRVSEEDLFGSRVTVVGDEYMDVTSARSVSSDMRAAFQGRILATGEAGSDLHLVLPRNLSGAGKYMPNLRRFDRGTAVVLMWEDGMLTEAERSRLEEGYVADLAVADIDGDERPEIVMAVNRPTGVLLKAKGSLVIWNPDEAD